VDNGRVEHDGPAADHHMRTGRLAAARRDRVGPNHPPQRVRRHGPGTTGGQQRRHPGLQGGAVVAQPGCRAVGTAVQAASLRGHSVAKCDAVKVSPQTRQATARRTLRRLPDRRVVAPGCLEPGPGPPIPQRTGTERAQRRELLPLDQRLAARGDQGGSRTTWPPCATPGPPSRAAWTPRPERAAVSFGWY
jgi:hypothetical protein